MRKFLFVLFIFSSGFIYSQRLSIFGNVQDTIAKVPLQYAVAMAIRINDSTLVSFARTDKNGHFELKNLAIDTLQIIISSPKFGDQFFYVFASASNYEFDFGKIILPPKSQLLKEVVIYAYKDPVYYKGDTLIYTADSFKVKPNATVEDLLRKLPGIKVDAQGKITSQGKEVSQVLVDGDEFFGADPTVATKNLAANGVESVQVYEKKNEDAAEGEDETIQVMNLKLKDDAKKGYFGKISVASDFQKFYEGELLANKFKGPLKISVFALASNTPRSGFGWNDTYKYGLDNEMNYSSDEEGTTYWMNNSEKPKGIPKTFKSGFYFSDKITKKTKLNLNYTYNTNQMNASGSTHSQYFLSDTSYITDNTSNNIEESNSHSINFKLTQTVDSLTELEIEPKFKLNESKQNNYQRTDFMTSLDTLSRQTDVINTNKANGYNMNTKVRLNKRFKKRDRLLRMTYNFTMNDDKSDGNLKAFNTFYNSTVSNDSIDQKKINSGNSQIHNGLIVYTEPITKKIKLEFEYNYNYNIGKQSKKAYNNLNGEYSVFDDSLSNDFENTRVTNRIGAKFIYEVKKQFFNFGAKARNVSIVNANLITEQNVKQSVNNILPFMGYMYKFSDNSRFNFRYNTNSSQPTLSQLQPVPDNSNPNQVKKGNPDLLPTFAHNFQLSLNSYKPISGKYFWFNANLNMIQNAFANNTTYDSVGRTISQTVNVDGNYSANFYLGSGLPFFSKMLEIGPNINGSYNSYSSFINYQKNITKTLNANAGLSLTIRLDTLDFSISYNFDYNAPTSTLSTSTNSSYTEQQFNANLTFRLPFKFLLETDAEYRINSRRAEGYNINYVLWNATLSKLFLKNENFIVSLTGNDILNQNISTSRSIQDNVIIDNKTNIISRYFLLKLTYKFNSTKTKDDENDMF